MRPVLGCLALFAALLPALPIVSLHGVTATAAELEPLKYNHPGLTVDLGVGLWAWPVPCDADGDGDFDLIVSCPDAPSNGIWLFENTTGSTATEKFPVFRPARRLSRTRHYVMPSYVDGRLRVLTPGYEHPEFTKTGLQQRVKLPASTDFYQLAGTQTKGPGIRHRQWRYTDYDGDGAADLVIALEDWSDYGWDDAWNPRGEWTNGPLHGFIFLLRNQGTTAEPRYAPAVQLQAGGKPIDVYGCPSPNFADFDGDGDLDLLCGEFLNGFTYFKNTGTRQQPRYAAGHKLTLSGGQPLEMELQMIVPVAFDWDTDGHIDLIVGDEDGRVALVEHTGRLHADGSPVFLPPRYFRQQADTLKCGALATPVGFDWDGDGDTDLLSGNTAGFIEFFENLSGPHVEQPKWAAPVRLQAGGQTFRVMAGANGSVQGPAEARWGYTVLSVADWNHDKRPDILFNSIHGRVQWLENIGTRTAPRLAAPQPVEVAWQGETPRPDWTWWTPRGKELVTQWRTTPCAVDWNRDGLTDLAMLDREGFLCLFERAERDGRTVLLPPQRVMYGTNFSATDSRHRTLNPSPGPLQLNSRTAGGSGRRKLCLVDWDGDGQLDILANSTSANFLRQTAARDGRWYFRDEGPLVTQNIQGHSTSPTVVDFNGDGVPDFLGGAEDGRFYYQRNPRSARASGNTPSDTTP